MTNSTRTRRIQWLLAGPCLFLLLLGAGVGILSIRGASSHSGAAAAPSIRVDSRLVLHRQTVPFSDTLAGGVTLTGTLSPSLPGLNTLTLRLHVPDRQAARDGQIELEISMPGMAMRPIRAILAMNSHGFSGYAALPMFGRYRAQMQASIGGRRYMGEFLLTVPLTLNL
jgi:hypothetical protein